ANASAHRRRRKRGHAQATFAGADRMGQAHGSKIQWPGKERDEVRSEISFRLHWKGLAAAVFAGAIMLVLPTGPKAQQVVAFVNGQPITVLDIEHRAKFLQMSSKKVPSRKEVMDSLIDEILEITEAKRFGLEIPDEQVNDSYNLVATRMGIDGPKLTQLLT